MKKVTACMLFLTIFLLHPVTAQAQETILTAVVPSSHTIHLALTGEGSVLVDEVAYTKTADIQVQRQHRPKISVWEADGSKIKTVLWGSEDVTAAFQDGKWTAPEIMNDAALTVTFEKISSPPQTGDNAHPELWFALLIFSMFGLIVCLLRRKKKCV
jgi:hypothetical protein